MKINSNQKITFQNIEKILKELNLMEKIKKRENEYNNYCRQMKSLNKKMSFDKINNENIFYPINFVILNEEIYNEILNKYNINNKEDDCKAHYFISDKKIIIEYTINNNYILLIGTIDKENDKFISEILLNYFEAENMRKHFNYLKNRDNILSIESMLSNDEKEIYFDNEFENVLIGNIFNLKNNNKKGETELMIENSVNNAKKNHIEFLLRLFFHNERINYKINQCFGDNIKTEKYYLLNY